MMKPYRGLDAGKAGDNQEQSDKITETNRKKGSDISAEEEDPQKKREESEFPSKADPATVPDKDQNKEDVKNVDPERDERTF